MKLRVYFHGSKEGSCFLHRNCKRTPEELKKNTTALIIRIDMHCYNDSTDNDEHISKK